MNQAPQNPSQSIDPPAKTEEQLPLLSTLHLDLEVVGGLPPELRDPLLDLMRHWGAPAEQLALAAALRAAHGPLLSLLDYEANAYLLDNQPQAALDVIERRQRRSTTIASQVIEAQALLASGRDAHAQGVADDISHAYPKHVGAVCGAAHIYAGLGRFDHARLLLEGYLAHRPGDQLATLMLARLAYEAGDADGADAYIQRLGAGIPTELGNDHLQQLEQLLVTMGRAESAKAVQLELGRRRQVELAALQQTLAPYTAQQGDAHVDPAQLYHQLSGPESIPVSRQEQRTIQLEAVRHFGFMKLRSGQIEVMASVLRGDSILTVMPTGAGKSLCYQLPALILPKPTLVISPLIALMKDQVESLPAAARAKATFINSMLSEEELAQRMAGIAQGAYKLIYAAPERLRQRAFLRALRGAGVDLFVVDEAHCVSLWGHDFRPDYLFIQEARRELGNPTALAMTATAPPRVRDEIIDYISDDGADEDQGEGAPASSPHRPRALLLDIFRSNLHLSALHFHNEDEKLAALIHFVTNTAGAGIVYVNSRHKAESLAHHLRGAGISAEAYHAGLADRNAVQDRFMSDKTRVVVATIAFGMGIDKADIRFIVHFHPSRSLAAYYQEVGRAGRNGQPSQGVLYYSNNDWANLRRWAKADEYAVEFLEKVYAAIATQLGIERPAVDGDGEEKTDPPTPFVVGAEPAGGVVDARRLQQVVSADETTVRVAVSMLERAGLLTRSFDLPQEVTISIPRRAPKTTEDDDEYRQLLRGMNLRPGQANMFKTTDVAAFMGWPLYESEAILLDWQAAGWLEVAGERRAMLIDLAPLPEDGPAGARRALERLVAQSAAIAQRRIDEVVGYATADTCRHGYISAHFGSPPRSRCDVCDICTGIRPATPARSAISTPLPDDADIEPMLIDCLISLPKPVGRSGLARILAGNLRAPVTPDKARHFGRLKALGEESILGYIDDLIEDGRLRQYERQGYLALAPTMRGRAEAEIWLAEHPDLADMAPAPAVDSEQGDEPAEAETYTALQKALWLWRRRVADQQGVPPYVVMSNELMLRIAESRPKNEEELAHLPGMGEQRMQHYGPAVLDLVKLNPAHEGDANLLVAQRAAQTEATDALKQKAQQAANAVSPQVERRIFLKLQELRQKTAIGERVAPYTVAGNTLLKSIAQQAPSTREGLEAILGFRSSGLRDKAEQVLAIIAQARQGA
ncbi:MAG: RecQ family ATP-dependent DNA helicase [Caldilineaceae bacterium]|nr:RecQ family ATP-dependent DNA helicase [Caldilineaceae bacterium]